MSKRTERAEYRAELISVLRRIAASLERDQSRRDLANKPRGMEPAGFIHTRGPLEGQLSTEDEWDEPRWLECWDANVIATPSRTIPTPFGIDWNPIVRLTDISIDMYDELVIHRGEHGRDGGEVRIDDEGKRIRLNVKRMPTVGNWMPAEEEA
ncbi:hypothetical protein [Rhodococcus sp. 1168]|uniref:hypothetical protein n=1 Tax=Rhodococcus sp. 1168 TaxID=2018041 RepID=UPI000A098700|nr:hypothetical protein [Rhodococcus sp. 1168]ORI13447.1 hypothetical protein BJI47_22650 [Rhodococcus sp. 1168]